jgi:hypothetical protein
MFRRLLFAGVPQTFWLSMLAAKEESGAVWGRFDHARPGVGTPEWSLMIGATALLIIVITYSLWRSRREKLEFLSNSAPRMFNELSRAHRLDRAHKRLLKKLAAAQGHQNAAALFVEPEYFDKTKMPATLAGSTQQIRQLRHELFD